MNRYEYSILSICEKLHGYVTNRYEMPDAEAEMYVAWLRFRLETWSIGPNSSKYDEIVRTLIKNVIYDYENV